MCREERWNEKKGLCKQCAPDLGVEMAAAQADKSVEEVWAHAKMAEEDKHLTEADWREGITASCPSCGAPQATNARFCAHCGPTSRRRSTAHSAGPSWNQARSSARVAARQSPEREYTVDYQLPPRLPNMGRPIPAIIVFPALVSPPFTW